MPPKFSKSSITSHKDANGEFVLVDTDDPGSYWFYFLRDKSNERSLCRDCIQTISCKERSTSGMKRHLSRVHFLNIEDYKQSNEKKSRFKFDQFMCALYTVWPC